MLPELVYADKSEFSSYLGGAEAAVRIREKLIAHVSGARNMGVSDEELRALG